MASTLIVLRTDVDGETGLQRIALYLSQEYLPHKERDDDGVVLPNQEWQHPEPTELHYCHIGTLHGDDRVVQMLEATLHLGNSQFGGHGRLLVLDTCPWINEHLETWEDRHAREAEEQAQRDEGLAAEWHREWTLATPVFAYCQRCEQSTEQCKGPSHRGSNRCMRCCGGVGDTRVRYCANCLDLPYREHRERAINEPITYSGEELD
jgi:hypothetical protein